MDVTGNIPIETEAAIDSDRVLCPLCETSYLTLRHCKIVCEQCGYVESCEDNFLPMQDPPASETLRRSNPT